MGRKKIQENRSGLILEAASALFDQFGYEKTTLDDIALRAGIGKGSVYLEFANKEAILFALILENKRNQVAHMLKIAERTDKPALELLKIMLVQNVGMVFDSVQKNRRSPEEMAATREQVRTLLAPFFEARLALVRALLERARQQGEITLQPDLYHTAQLILLALRSVLPPYERADKRVKLQNQAAELLALIFTGLKPNDRTCL
ncbi:TetR/AcrR family transcriptional regulator [Vampirovibrio sp.]|uniref:TetR/AcrR family transcriptional regulator n=1 Tax=Vampirovibrio sp. TaxID=2717857 RepID=UPI0035941591